MGLRDTVQRMYLQGLEDESLVMEVTKRKFGGNVRKPTRNEDMKEHIDFWWISDNGNEYGFDAVSYTHLLEIDQLIMKLLLKLI